MPDAAPRRRRAGDPLIDAAASAADEGGQLTLTRPARKLFTEWYYRHASEGDRLLSKQQAAALFFETVCRILGNFTMAEGY